MVASDEWLRDNQGRARGLTTAVLSAMKWLRTTPSDQVAQRIPSEYRMADNDIYMASIRRMVPALSLDGIMSARLPEQVKTVLSTFDANVRAANIDVSRTFTNEFIAGM